MSDEAKAVLLQAAGWVQGTATEINRIEALHIAHNLRLMADDVSPEEYETRRKRGFVWVLMNVE